MADSPHRLHSGNVLRSFMDAGHSAGTFQSEHRQAGYAAIENLECEIERLGNRCLDYEAEDAADVQAELHQDRVTGVTS